jgi:paraquat-inducible protein B
MHVGRTLDHRSPVCAQDENLKKSVLATASVRARVKRHLIEATQWWGVHPTVGAHTGEGLQMAL